MIDAGLDIDILSPHSLQAASCSKAMKACVPISTILETAGWTRESTLHEYDNKPTEEEGRFGIAELEDNWYAE